MTMVYPTPPPLDLVSLRAFESQLKSLVWLMARSDTLPPSEFRKQLSAQMFQLEQLRARI